MRKIVQGIRHFQTCVFRQQRELFEMLARKQQNPLALFITCADSRIHPNLITSTEPGELFLLRNAGNIVPPHGAANGGEGATIEYAVSVLKVRNLIVCGHYGCGAMAAMLRPESAAHLPAVQAWFSHAEATRRILRERYSHLSPEAQHDLATELNVLVQIDNIRTHPSVAAALATGELNLYGWVYRIETGEILAYDPTARKFQPLCDSEPPPYPAIPPFACVPAS